MDLIILDLMLPGMDGFEICRRIRDEKTYRFSWYLQKKDDIDKIRGLGLGADDYMTKPFSPSGACCQSEGPSCPLHKAGQLPAEDQ